MFKKKLAVALIAAATATGVISAGAAVEDHGYPRIMGMNIARPAYYDTLEYQQALSKPDIVILGFWEGWSKSKKNISERDVVRRLKQMNPKLLVGQYTILSEWKSLNEPFNTRQDVSRKLDAENWWLGDEGGNRVQWTDIHHAWDINITAWTRRDHRGDRYPEWLAKKDYETFFQPVPEFDIWYFDNAVSKPPVKRADWNLDGRNDANDDPEIAQAHRAGHVTEWQEARKLRPDILLMGNTDDLSSVEFSGRLHGAFLEALIGKSWSMERWKGWEIMMDRYHATMKHTAPPHIVGFNVHGRVNDYQRMRYGLASCLMDNGYFNYTDENVGYGSVPWFDEYDVELGKPVDPPPVQPWQKTVYRRRFEHGQVLVNPSTTPQSVTIEAGYRRITGSQAPNVNDGTGVSLITLPGKDGIILLKSTN